MNKQTGKFVFTAIASALLASAAMAQQDIDRIADTSATPSVTVEIDNGELVIEVWDKDQVRLVGEVDDRVQRVQFESQSDNAVDIDITEDEGGFWNGGGSDTDLTLHVPRGSRVSVESVNTVLEVTGLEGQLDIETVNGPVALKQLSGRVSVDTVNGPVSAEALSNDVEIESVNGPIDVTQTGGDRLELGTVNGPINVTSTAEDIRLEAVNGPARFKLDKVRRFKAETVSGGLDGRLHLLPRGDLSIDAVSGDVELTLVEPLNISVSIENMRGDIDNEINDADPIKRDYGLGQALQFSQGDASAEVRINSVASDIRLRRD